MIATPISELILARLGENDRVLDIGGARYPWFRATHILDKRTFEQKVGPTAFAGRPPHSEPERFSRETWIVRDFYDLPWPFPDKYFEFSLCMGTLEDLRDPLPICREIVRVSKAGYISTPTRAAESSPGVSEHPTSNRLLGYAHHRWFMEIERGGLVFKWKTPLLYQNTQWQIPQGEYGQHTLNFFWEGSFSAREMYLAGHDEALADLARFKDRHGSWMAEVAGDPTDAAEMYNAWPAAWGPRPRFRELVRGLK